MSVIVRDPDGIIKLLCKGAVSYLTLHGHCRTLHGHCRTLHGHCRTVLHAMVVLQDSVIYERMQISYPDFSRQTEKHLEQFAVDGLRTLCIAERELDEANYKVERHMVAIR